MSLSDLLVSLFTYDELSRFLMMKYREIYTAMPAGASLASLADYAVQALTNRGMVDDSLFAALRQDRPGRRHDIAKVRALCTPVIQRHFSWGIAGGGLTVAGVATFLSITPAPGVETMMAPPRDTVRSPVEVSAEGTVTTTRPSFLCPEGMVHVVPAPSDEVAPFCLDSLEVSRKSYGLHCPTASPLADTLDPALALVYSRCAVEGRPAGEWERHPMVSIKPTEAARYCEDRGHRLATKAEWNIAALMDLRDREAAEIADCVNLCGHECWGREYNHSLGWFEHSDPYPRSSPVGSYMETCPAHNGLGDILGNAREIVRSGRVFSICGSGWRSNTPAHLDPYQWCRPLGVTESQIDFGFRCAADLETTPSAE